VGVRSEEMPESSVVMPSCVVERPGAEQGGATGRSAARAKPAQASSNATVCEGGQEGAESIPRRRRPWKTPGNRERVSRDPPA
jgi:hypothetical protein